MYESSFVDAKIRRFKADSKKSVGLLSDLLRQEG